MYTQAVARYRGLAAFYLGVNLGLAPQALCCRLLRRLKTFLLRRLKTFLLRRMENLLLRRMENLLLRRMENLLLRGLRHKYTRCFAG